ncbi:MAG: LysR substrate-binding domain-containing protein [Pseudomonas sp.]|uniref:LysR family transcriptional regulator n=1 Tax=Pseudomonas abieticivorans TaxID=2931382 RepID=UPI0020BF61D4|nr:LysR family transcriptional regulator [Pseudomonas sp. PIA16]MDE1164431.1 LysR substrate-binding domain-containing protein [Pseudomonas sp.]
MAKLNLLDGIPEFVATAQTGSFSAAAKLLDTSVANTSRKVGALERRLEQQLLQRTARGCVLNEAGQQFYKQCRALLDGLEEAHDEVRLGRSELKGSIKVSLAGHFAETTLLPLLAEFAEAFPRIQLFINVIARNVDLVSEGVDLSIRLGPLVDSNLIAKRLITFPGRTLIAPRLLERLGPLNDPRALQPEQCLSLLGRAWHFKKGALSHHLLPGGRLGSDNGLALVAAASRGLGIIQVPSYYGTPELERGDLVTLFPQWDSGDEFAFYLVFPPTRYIPARVRALADFLTQRLA